MVCYTPLDAFYGPKGDSGKRGLVFSRQASFSGVRMKIPCSQCYGCRLDRSYQTALRCMHEHRTCRNAGADSSFVTLTYDDAHLPVDGSLSIDDLQRFMKRLRWKTGEGVRFYACGEYGSTTNRPHYHVLLFNRSFDDKRFYGYAKRGERLYTSEKLRALWPDGNNIIGDVTFDSCAYVARYVVDKITGEMADDWYAGRQPEFATRSLKPGIGADWYAQYGSQAHELDSVIVNGFEKKMPRYYDKMFEAVDPEAMAAIKEARRRKVLRIPRSENSPDRRRVREIFEIHRLRANKKGL